MSLRAPKTPRPLPVRCAGSTKNERQHGLQIGRPGWLGPRLDGYLFRVGESHQIEIIG